MKKSFSNAQIRKIDETLTIFDIFDGKDFAFDFVIAELNGKHPKVINKKSDRVYFFLGGQGRVYVGDQSYEVSSQDLITIKAGTPHGLEGQLRYIIITAPPFNPQNEALA